MQGQQWYFHTLEKTLTDGQGDMKWETDNERPNNKISKFNLYIWKRKQLAII